MSRTTAAFLATVFAVSLAACGPTMRDAIESNCVQHALCDDLWKDLRTGEHGPKDPVRATNMMVDYCRQRKTYNASMPETLCADGHAYAHTLFLEDPNAGLALYQRLCDADYLPSCLAIAEAYSCGSPPPKPERCKEWAEVKPGPSAKEITRAVRRKVSCDHGPLCYTIKPEEAKKVPANFAGAIGSLEQLCERGAAARESSSTSAAQQACRAVVAAYAIGDGVPQDEDKADRFEAKFTDLQNQSISQNKTLVARLERDAARSEREAQRLDRENAERDARNRELGQAVVGGLQQLTQTATDLSNASNANRSSPSPAPASRPSTPAPPTPSTPSGAAKGPGKASGNVPDACAGRGESCGDKRCCWSGAASQLSLQCRANRCCGGYGGFCNSDGDCCDAPVVSCQVARNSGQTVCCKKSGVAASSTGECCSGSLAPPSYNNCL